MIIILHCNCMRYAYSIPSLSVFHTIVLENANVFGRCYFLCLGFTGCKAPLTIIIELNVVVY